MEWEENRIYDSEEDELLPSWLAERSDIIIDASCIHIGSELGYGTRVFEGKYRLGNGVYANHIMPL